MDLKKKASSSIGWISLGSLITYALKFLAKIILARLLVPADFGLFAILLVFTNSLALFSTLGLGSALVQSKEKIVKAANAAFFISLIMGVISFVLSYFLAPYISLFFAEPNLTKMIRIFAITFIFLGVENVPSSLLVKELKFGRKAIVEIVSVFVFFAITVSLAGYLNQGVWSLVYGQFFSMLVSAIGMMIAAKFIPTFEIDADASKKILSYGKHIIITCILSYFLTQGDSFFVGKMLGTVYLGYYAFAYNIANLPSRTISLVISAVSFSVFAQLQDDTAHLKRAYLKILRLSYVVIFPMASGIFIVSPEFIRIVLGEKWIPCIPVLQILCFFAIFRSFHNVGGYFFQAIDEPKVIRNVHLFELILIILLIYPLSIKYGIVGTGLAVTISFLIGATYLLFRVRSKLKIKHLLDIKILFLELSSSTIMVFLVFILKEVFFNITTMFQLVIIIIIGAIIYLGCSYILYLTVLKEVIEISKTNITEFTNFHKFFVKPQKIDLD